MQDTLLTWYNVVVDDDVPGRSFSPSGKRLSAEDSATDGRFVEGEPMWSHVEEEVVTAAATA